MVEKKTLSFSIGVILVLTTVVSVVCSNIALYFSLASKQTKPVVVAKRELASGSKLTRQDVEIKQFLVAQVPEGVFSNPDEILGMTTIGRLPQGQLIHQSNISSGFSAPTPSSFKAVSVKIDDASGHKLNTVKVGELISLSTCEMTIIGSTPVYSIDVPSSRLVVLVDYQQLDLILEFEPITGGFQIGKEEGGVIVVSPVSVKIDDASGHKLNTVKVGELISLSTCEMTIIGSTPVYSIDVPSSRLVVLVDYQQLDLILEFEPITGGFQIGKEEVGAGVTVVSP